MREGSDAVRLAIITTCALIAVTLAACLGWNATSAFAGYFRLRAFAFQTVIYAVQIFLPLVIVAAVVLYSRRTRSVDADSP